MALTFALTGEQFGGRTIRPSRFERRSELPVPAACIVANGIRETLSQLLARPVSVTLTEPVIPELRAWELIAAGARIFRLRGQVTDVAVVLRPVDALALVSALFDERAADLRELSAIEIDVLSRMMQALRTSLDAVCGLREGVALEPVAHAARYSTYFEILIGAPIEARIGIALATEPTCPIRGALQLADLLDVELEVSAGFSGGSVEARTLLALQPGAVVPMTTEVGSFGTLKVAGSIVARGECGAVAGRNAFLVGNNDGN